eukprot:TRINITY_DN29044_c0_g1_i3.p1 TRINITY_DN29044_c0_g1~~TRINITY_DN29044_c0_g1_i3.p1  ORF type:complete len:267 (-),score=17.06 TRINITY_DN29044_c0_g1_i3:267-1067(-)
MTSDDTEHTWIVAEALLRAQGDAVVFEQEMARGLRWWFLSIPPATGFATMRACLQLLLGFGPARSGVFSAGNGPAMRSALIGVYFRDDLDRMRSLVRVCTRITHTDVKAEYGALAVALAAAGRLETFDRYCRDGEFVARVRLAAAGVFDPGEGVSGYIYDTVPAALASFSQNRGDFRGTVQTAIGMGGDTDTVAAIAGAICGAHVGEARIPREWVDGICDWPRSVAGMRRLASGDPPRLWLVALISRNVFFFPIALWHAVVTILRR